VKLNLSYGGIKVRKLGLALLAVAVMAGASFAAQGSQFVNVRASAGITGDLNISGQGQSLDESTRVGFSVAGEYLFGIHEMFSIGAGIEYVFPTKLDDHDSRISYLPIYFTVKANPIATRPEVFFQANIGWVASANFTNTSGSQTGGLYWAIGAGYEFAENWLAGIMYSSYATRAGGADFTFTRVGINVGHRFRI